MGTAVCVLDPAGFEETQISHFRKNYNVCLRKRWNVTIGICVLYRMLYLKLFLSRNLFNFDKHCI